MTVDAGLMFAAEDADKKGFLDFHKSSGGKLPHIHLSKQLKNELIMALHNYAHDHNGYEMGLPVYDEAQMAKMREIIDEVIYQINKHGEATS